MADIESVDMMELVLKWSGVFNLPPELVYGIIQVESGGNPLAVRHEPGYRFVFDVWRVRPDGCSTTTEETLQKTSWGCMQVMGSVLRERGYMGWLTGILKNMDAQIEYGCRHLAHLARRWGGDIKKGVQSYQDAVAAYNAGSPRFGQDGKYLNQQYVDKVLRIAEQFAAARAEAREVTA